MNYIFESLYASEKAIKCISKNLKYQRVFNSQLIVFAGVTVAYMALTNKSMKDQNKKIDELTKELDKLKVQNEPTTEGE